jgi:hydroxymethylglutaryl-CoA lyase
MGLRRFDSSIGALGGCPFLPGATGNIATERVVEILDSLGFETGVELTRLASIRTEIFAALKK